MSSPVRGPARAPDRTSGTTGEHRVLLGVLLVTTMTGIVGSLGAPLIPQIARDEGVSLTIAQWALTAPLLVAAVSSPLIGRLGVGRRRRPVLLTCLALVALGTLLAALPLGFGVAQQVAGEQQRLQRAAQFVAGELKRLALAGLAAGAAVQFTAPQQQRPQCRQHAQQPRDQRRAQQHAAHQQQRVHVTALHGPGVLARLGAQGHRLA